MAGYPIYSTFIGRLAEIFLEYPCTSPHNMARRTRSLRKFFVPKTSVASKAVFTSFILTVVHVEVIGERARSSLILIYLLTQGGLSRAAHVLLQSARSSMQAASSAVLAAPESLCSVSTNVVGAI